MVVKTRSKWGLLLGFTTSIWVNQVIEFTDLQNKIVSAIDVDRDAKNMEFFYQTSMLFTMEHTISLGENGQMPFKKKIQHFAPFFQTN